MHEPAVRCSLEQVRQRFAGAAMGVNEGAAGGRPVAIARAADGRPKLLSRRALGTLCDEMAALAEGADLGGELEAEVPAVLQVGAGAGERAGAAAGATITHLVPCCCAHTLIFHAGLCPSLPGSPLRHLVRQ